jgi:hypothetical protein
MVIVRKSTSEYSHSPNIKREMTINMWKSSARPSSRSGSWKRLSKPSKYEKHEGLNQEMWWINGTW